MNAEQSLFSLAFRGPAISSRLGRSRLQLAPRKRDCSQSSILYNELLACRVTKSFYLKIISLTPVQIIENCFNAYFNYSNCLTPNALATSSVCSLKYIIVKYRYLTASKKSFQKALYLVQVVLKITNALSRVRELSFKKIVFDNDIRLAIRGTQRFISVNICSKRFSCKENLKLSSSKCQLKISYHWRLITFVRRDKYVVKTSGKCQLELTWNQQQVVNSRSKIPFPKLFSSI